jgi:hypothetical protein
VCSILAGIKKRQDQDPRGNRKRENDKKHPIRPAGACDEWKLTRFSTNAKKMEESDALLTPERQ